MAFTQQDTECMSLALKLSELGRASVGANPMVGCVITRDDEIIAEDFHHQYGEGHAEINALEKVFIAACFSTCNSKCFNRYILF